MRWFQNWLTRQSGATAIEYGLLLAGVVLAILLAVNLLGDNLANFFYNDLPSTLE